MAISESHHTALRLLAADTQNWVGIKGPRVPRLGRHLLGLRGMVFHKSIYRELSAPHAKVEAVVAQPSSDLLRNAGKLSVTHGLEEPVTTTLYWSNHLSVTRVSFSSPHTGDPDRVFHPADDLPDEVMENVYNQLIIPMRPIILDEVQVPRIK